MTQVKKNLYYKNCRDDGNQHNNTTYDIMLSNRDSLIKEALIELVKQHQNKHAYMFSAQDDYLLRNDNITARGEDLINISIM